MNKPTLFGYGLTTKAIAKKLGGGCKIFDDNTDKIYLDEYNNQIIPSYKFDKNNSDLEVVTPSFKPSNPLTRKARNIISEYDYFLSPLRVKKKPFTIWISGTNGKTTTTQMLTSLLKDKGAVNGGNIGTPLAELDINAPIWILETSSFTLHHTKEASPNIYILLPITPDHLDWHGGEKEYKEDKLRPLLTMKEGEMALVPKGLNLPKSDAFIVEYDSSEFLADYFDININKMNFKSAFLEDALLALAVTKALFDEIDYDKINSFKLDAHRQELIYDHKRREWVNDSKATNIDATIKALETFNEKFIHLIIGGVDKGVDLNELFLKFQIINIKIYTIGRNSDRLIGLAQKYNIKALKCDLLEVAVQEIDKVLDKDSIALLSPASASFDQFKSYKDRGDTFKNKVANL